MKQEIATVQFSLDICGFGVICIRNINIVLADVIGNSTITMFCSSVAEGIFRLRNNNGCANFLHCVSNRIVITSVSDCMISV